MAKRIFTGALFTDDPVSGGALHPMTSNNKLKQLKSRMFSAKIGIASEIPTMTLHDTLRSTEQDTFNL